MAKITDIPYLVHLLDDESPSVREQVKQELKGLGKADESALMPFIDNEEIGVPSRDILQEIIEELRLQKYEKNALNWLQEEDERKAQEEALSWLSYLSRDQQAESLTALLDELTDKFLKIGKAINVDALFKFLFEDEGFSQPEDQFYKPENSNLIQVIQRKQGLQLSLTMIAVFIARRLGLPLYGFNMPGHFLILNEQGRKYRVYDPFGKGQEIPTQTITYIQRMMAQRSKPMSVGKAATEQIVFRVFRNFMNAFQRQENQKMYGLFNEKYERLKGVIREKNEL